MFAPDMTDAHVVRLARAMVVALSLISLYFAIYSSSTLVSLLLLPGWRRWGNSLP